MWLFASEVSADYYTTPTGIVSMLMLTITYIQVVSLNIHTQGRFTNQTAGSLYRIMVMATSVAGVTKMGNSVTRVGIEPTSLAFRASALPLHQID